MVFELEFEAVARGTNSWMQGSEHSYVPPEYEGRDTVLKGRVRYNGN